MSYRPHAAPRGRRLALALCAGLAFGLAACDRDSDTAVAVREAEGRLRALTPAGGQPVSVEYRQKVYTEVRGKLQGTLNSGSKSENAAAAVLLAQSQAGLAQIPAAEASDLAQESLHDQVKARSVLSRWLAHTAMANAAAKYDPKPEIDALDAEGKRVDEALGAAQQKKGQVDKQVADLHAQSQQKSEAAKGMRQAAGGLKAKITNETAVNGAELMRQAREVGRQADAQEVEAANLEARAAQIAPQSGEAQLEIDKLNLQKEMLSQSRAGVQKRTQDAKAQETGARTEADGVAKDMASLVQSLLTRQDQIKAKTDEAVKGFQSAADAARKGVSEIKGTSQMALGSAMQSAGDASWSLAQSYESLADTLESIAKASFNPPGAPEMAAKATESRAAAKAALDQATEQYKAAHDAYEGAGGKAQAGEVLKRLTDGLAGTLKKTSGGAVDLGTPEPASEPAKPAEGGAPAAAAPATGEAGAVQASLQQMIDFSKTGDYDKIADLVATDTPEQKQAVKAMLGLAPKFKALDAAMKAKFGTGMQEMAGAMGGAGAPDFGDLEKLKASDIPVEVSGETAKAKLPGKDLGFKKVEGKWLIDLGSQAATPQQMAMMSQMTPAIAKAVDELTADVTAGKVPSAQAAMMALMGKMSRAAQPPGGAPKGGGG